MPRRRNKDENPSFSMGVDLGTLVEIEEGEEIPSRVSVVFKGEDFRVVLNAYGLSNTRGSRAQIAEHILKMCKAIVNSKATIGDYALVKKSELQKLLATTQTSNQ